MLYLIRHSRPDVPAGLCYGQLDVPVDDLALADALAELAPALRELGPCRLWSSPLQRCRQLADGLAARLGITAEIDARLGEIHFGDWEGRLWADIPRAELDAWAADVVDFQPPRGESVAILQARVLDWLAELPADRPQVAVTHAGVIRVLCGALQGLPVADWSTQAVAHAALTPVLRTGRMPRHE